MSVREPSICRKQRLDASRNENSNDYKDETAMSAARLDTTLGFAAAGLGSTGLTIQVLTQWMTFGVAALNLALAMAGLYLLWRRIRRMHRGEQRRRDDD